MTYYYLYETKNLINNKIYVGVHKTNNLEDGYMGSGKIIKAAIVKHGIENFQKTILEFFETSEEMYLREKEIVDDEFLEREDTYNLRRGGTGGFDYLNKTGLNNSSKTKEAKQKSGFITQAKLRNNPELKEKIMQGLIDGFKKAHKEGKIKYKPRTGQIQSESEKEKRRTTMKQNKHQQGKKNSQFGTCWIYHEEFGNKKIKKEHLDEYLNQGWIKGRKILRESHSGRAVVGFECV